MTHCSANAEPRLVFHRGKCMAPLNRAHNVYQFRRIRFISVFYETTTDVKSEKTSGGVHSLITKP
jgi:hypothetical protein